MPPTLVRDFPPRRRTSVAMLLALLALAAITQVLAPAPASAVINQGTVNGCIITVDLETEKIEAKTSDGGVCPLTEKELIALAEKGGFGGSVYYPTGTAPEQPAPPVDPCQNPLLCKPPGGRATDTPPDDVLHDKKVPPKGGGSQKGEVKKPPKVDPKVAEKKRKKRCQSIFKTMFQIQTKLTWWEEMAASKRGIDVAYLTDDQLEAAGMKEQWDIWHGDLKVQADKARADGCSWRDLPKTP